MTRTQEAVQMQIAICVTITVDDRMNCTGQDLHNCYGIYDLIQSKISPLSGTCRPDCQSDPPGNLSSWGTDPFRTPDEPATGCKHQYCAPGVFAVGKTGADRTSAAIRLLCPQPNLRALAGTRD